MNITVQIKDQIDQMYCQAAVISNYLGEAIGQLGQLQKQITVLEKLIRTEDDGKHENADNNS